MSDRVRKFKNLSMASTVVALLFSHVGLAAPLCRDAALRQQPPVSPAAISEAPDLQSDLQQLIQASSPWSKQPFAFKALEGTGGLPLDPQLFANARYVVATEPRFKLPPGAQVFEKTQFGYQLSDGFRKLGNVNYIVVSEGRVIEIGGGSKRLLTELQNHIQGRRLSGGQLRRLEQLNRKLMDQLRADPRAQAKLKAFVEKRGWPEGIAEEAQLAYFSKDILSLFAWAEKNGYSRDELRDAGWVLLKFDQNGRPFYSVNFEDSIKIPYFADAAQTRIPIWRTRMLADRNDGKKYLGWQTDRSVDRVFTPAETLYNGWRLNEARGKTLVITEGEFKCMIATKTSGFLTLGIPGITQFDRSLADAVTAAQPSRSIVVLDRDPIGKGLMRVDGITDSQRAAYSIAKELQAAGAKNVSVGTLPDVFDGEKVGADDLILAKGVAPYIETLNTSVDPEVYAKQIGLNTALNRKIALRQNLSKALDNYQSAKVRGRSVIAADMLTRLQTAFNSVRADVNASMRTLYGATSLQNPAAKFASLKADPLNEKSDVRVATTVSGEQQPQSVFAQPILLLDYGTSDFNLDSCTPVPCASLGFSQAEIRTALQGQPSAEVAQTLARADDVLKASAFTPKTPGDWTTAFFAGDLAHSFPLDEYRFEFNMRFASGQIVPLVIYKKSSNRVVALARLRATALSAPQDPGLLTVVGQGLRR